MTTSRLSIAGMTCEHCCLTVTEALSALPDVTAVSVSLTDAAAVVEHGESFDSQDARAALGAVGYLVES